MGQSDAAWAFLGTTIRLAQTMGLHTEKSTVHWPENVRKKAKTLWYEKPRSCLFHIAADESTGLRLSGRTVYYVFAMIDLLSSP